jgi:hypothetical protein
MMFHGNGGTAESDVKETGWMAKSDAAGFIAVFPEATRPDMTQPPKFGLRDFRRIFGMTPLDYRRRSDLPASRKDGAT